MDEKRQVVLVSSGAVGAGIGRLGLKQRPADLAHLQAVAAVGQSRLIESYNRALEVHGRHAAQILLTADDLNDRTRYLNVRNTLLALFQYGALPIINENDTVRVDELQRNVGDNDRLAAMVTNLLRAPLLVLLSDVEGLVRPPSERARRAGDPAGHAVGRRDARVSAAAAGRGRAESTEPRRHGEQTRSGAAGRVRRRERRDRQRPAAERAGRYPGRARRSARCSSPKGRP